MRNQNKYRIFAAICYAIPTIFSAIQFLAFARQGLFGDPFAVLSGILGVALDLIITLMIISSRKSISLTIALSARALIAIVNPAANILLYQLQINENLSAILSSLIYATVLVMLGLIVIAYASFDHPLCSKKSLLTRIFTVIFVIHCVSVATDFIHLLTSVSLATSLLSLLAMLVMEVLRVLKLIFLYKWISFAERHVTANTDTPQGIMTTADTISNEVQEPIEPELSEGTKNI